MRVARACLVAAVTAVVSVLGHNWSQLTGPRCPRSAASDPNSGPAPPADKIWEETRRVPVGAGRSPCPGRRVRQAGAAFLSPAGPPSPCARRRSVHHAVQGWLPGTVRDGGLPTYGPLTWSDREALGERAPTRRSARQSGCQCDRVCRARTGRSVAPTVWACPGCCRRC